MTEDVAVPLRYRGSPRGFVGGARQRLFEHLSASAFGSDRNGSDATPCSEADRADISSVEAPINSMRASFETTTRRSDSRTAVRRPAEISL